jgi:hypothetical protein
MNAIEPVQLVEIISFISDLIYRLQTKSVAWAVESDK